MALCGHTWSWPADCQLCELGDDTGQSKTKNHCCEELSLFKVKSNYHHNSQPRLLLWKSHSERIVQMLITGMSTNGATRHIRYKA